MEKIEANAIVGADIQGDVITCATIEKGIKILEEHNALPAVVEVSSPLAFEVCDMPSEENQMMMRNYMVGVKEMSGMRPGCYITDDFCTQEYDKGGENKMILYEVYLVFKDTSEFDIVRLVSKSREGAKLKAFNMSKFADLDYDDLVIEAWNKIEWEVNE